MPPAAAWPSRLGRMDLRAAPLARGPGRPGPMDWPGISHRGAERRAWWTGRGVFHRGL